MISLLSFEWLAIDGSGAVTLFAPSTVAQPAPFGRGQRGGERADEQRQGQPDRDLHGGLSRRVEIGLYLADDVVDPLLGVGLT